LLPDVLLLDQQQLSLLAPYHCSAWHHYYAAAWVWTSHQLQPLLLLCQQLLDVAVLHLLQPCYLLLLLLTCLQHLQHLLAALPLLPLVRPLLHLLQTGCLAGHPAPAAAAACHLQLLQQRCRCAAALPVAAAAVAASAAGGQQQQQQQLVPVLVQVPALLVAAAAAGLAHTADLLPTACHAGCMPAGVCSGSSSSGSTVRKAEYRTDTLLCT
jgi:hypothetical protein